MAKRSFHCEEHAAPKRPGEIEVLRRAFNVLEILAGQEEGLTLAELTRRSAYPKTTVYRILRALEGMGYVRCVGERPRFLVDGKMADLSAASRFRLLREAARSHIRALSEEFAETVNLGALAHGRVYLLEVLESAQSLRMGGTAGTYEPLHSTALGKAIAAHLEPQTLSATLSEHPIEPITSKTIATVEDLTAELERVRKQGYATDMGENVEGACCLAAPLFQTGRCVVGAISVSGPLTRLGLARRREVIRAVVEACRTVSRALGGG